MITLPYIDRDYVSVFNSIKEIFKTLEPRVEIDFEQANVETIITKILASCVDSLSYNQDANILEAFPSTARDARAIFDLLSIVGYTPKTARCCKVFLTLWNPSFLGTKTYMPFSRISIDGRTFYSPDEFSCTEGVTTETEWYQGTLISPDIRENQNEFESDNFIDKYYPNLNTSTIKQNLYNLPPNHINIDSRTLRIYTPDGRKLKYVENPYLTNITSSSYSLLPTVNSTGYSIIFSEDVSNGVVADNLYYFYVISEGYNIVNNAIPNFSFLDTPTPNFSYNYSIELSKEPETANEARKNIVYEFGWRDTPKAIVTKYDAERAILQNTSFIAAVDVRDGNDYSKCNPDLLDVQVFVKVNEEAEQRLTKNTAIGYQNRILSHINKFKMLPLSYQVHIDNIQTTENENVTQMYYWYPDITIYLKKQVDSKEASSILAEVYNALFERYKYENVDFNEVPKTVDIIETVQNASDIILYLDIDGIVYLDSQGKEVNKELITCSYTEIVPIQTNKKYNITLNTLNGKRNIQYHTVKIVDMNNNVIGFDNGDGAIVSQTGYLNNVGTIDYETGELNFDLALQAVGSQIYVYYKQETPTYCKFTNNGPQSIKISLESIKTNNSTI